MKTYTENVKYVRFIIFNFESTLAPQWGLPNKSVDGIAHFGVSTTQWHRLILEVMMIKTEKAISFKLNREYSITSSNKRDSRVQKV